MRDTSYPASYTPEVLAPSLREVYSVPDSDHRFDIAVDHVAEQFAGHDLPFDPLSEQ